MAIFMVFISFYFTFSIGKSLTFAILEYGQEYRFSSVIDLEAIEDNCDRIEQSYIYKYTNEILINIGMFRLFLAFCIIKCKGTEDII